MSPWRPCRWKQAGRRWRWSPAGNVRLSPTQTDPMIQGLLLLWLLREILSVGPMIAPAPKFYTASNKQIISSGQIIIRTQQFWQSSLQSCLDIIYRCPLSAAVTLAGHFWRYHLTRFEALCMELEHPNHMAQYWKQQWRKASRQQLHSNWIVTLPQVSPSVTLRISGLIPTISLFLLIRDLFWSFDCLVHQHLSLIHIWRCRRS